MKYHVKAIIAGDIVEIYTYEKIQRTGKDALKAPRGSKMACNDVGEGLAMKEAKNVKDAVRRTKQTLRRLINANVGNRYGERDKFFTLTYKENKTDLEKANKDFRSFIKKINYKINKKHSGLKYVCVVERQGRGAIHYHVIFFNLPYIKVDELTRIWGHGFTSINAIDNVDNVGAYVVKYMTKTIVEDDVKSARQKDKKMYFSSRGLYKPIEKIPTETDLKRLEKFIVYENEFENEFTGVVKYKQANLKRVKER